MKRESQSSDTDPRKSSRREFIELGGRAAAGSALAGVAIPSVHAAEDNTIRLALIGCGNRGSGAVANAMNSPHGPVKLVAMADVVEERITRAYKNLGRDDELRFPVLSEYRQDGLRYRATLEARRRRPLPRARSRGVDGGLTCPGREKN